MLVAREVAAAEVIPADEERDDETELADTRELALCDVVIAEVRDVFVITLLRRDEAELPPLPPPVQSQPTRRRVPAIAPIVSA